MSSRVQTATPVTPSVTKTGNHVHVPHDKIAKLAYEKWCKRGCPQGTSQKDWLEAEHELMMAMGGQTTQMRR